MRKNTYLSLKSSLNVSYYSAVFLLVLGMFSSGFLSSVSSEEGQVKAPVNKESSPARQSKLWSLKPLMKVTPPKVSNPQWIKNDIDRFILKHLEQAKLKPSKEASPRELLRRLYFDLIGSPPEFGTVQRFTKENNEDLYSKTVDKLLNNPEFGERWARHWLDVARFAESHGFEQDYDRPYAYHYRDFVIKAFNQDMPYDQFVRWQIAGDEIAPAEPLALMATGFLGSGVFPTQLTEKEFESARYDELDDMTQTMSMAFMGLTVGCARCHDHKSDPISSKDYYQLASTFTTTIRSEIDVSLKSKEFDQKLAVWTQSHTLLSKQLKTYEEKKLPKSFLKYASGYLEEAKSKISSKANPNLKEKIGWQLLRPTKLQSLEGATFNKLNDGSYRVGGKNPNHDRWLIESEIHRDQLTAIKVEALADNPLARKGPGRASNGNFSLSDIRIFIQPLSEKGKRISVKLVDAKATFEQNKGGLSAKSSIDKNKRTSGWAVDPQFGKDHAIVFEFEKPIGHPDGSRLIFELDFFTNTQHAIGRPRFSITSAPRPVAIEGDPREINLDQIHKEIIQAKDINALDRKTLQRLSQLYKSFDRSWQKLNSDLQNHLSKKPQTPKTKVMVSSEGHRPIRHHADGRGYPHFYKNTYLLTRGDPNQKNGIVEQKFLPILKRNGKTDQAWIVSPPSNSRTSFRRYSLAKWITDIDDGAGHLVARVIVNRLWQHHFGRGIVDTPNDFGVLGGRPSHPELLDWLAQKLIDHQWKLKPIHKLIVESATYRQSSKAETATLEKDRENRLLSRWTSRRLEAEVIRDSILNVSGQLDKTMYGPGTLNENSLRRSIYFKIKRSKLIPCLQLFDAPEPLVSQAQRPSTVIAPQALLFMNSPHIRKSAKSFAEKLIQHSSKDHSQQIIEAYRRCLNRSPSPTELKNSVKFLLKQREDYQKASKKDSHLLALMDFAQVMFSLNEFIYSR